MKTGPVWYVPEEIAIWHVFLPMRGQIIFGRMSPRTGSMSLSFEAVFDKAQQADFWLVKYDRDRDMTLDDC